MTRHPWLFVVGLSACTTTGTCPPDALDDPTCTGTLQVDDTQELPVFGLDRRPVVPSVPDALLVYRVLDCETTGGSAALSEYLVWEVTELGEALVSDGVRYSVVPEAAVEGYGPTDLVAGEAYHVYLTVTSTGAPIGAGTPEAWTGTFVHGAAGSFVAGQPLTCP